MAAKQQRALLPYSEPPFTQLHSHFWFLWSTLQRECRGDAAFVAKKSFAGLGSVDSSLYINSAAHPAFKPRDQSAMIKTKKKKSIVYFLWSRGSYPDHKSRLAAGQHHEYSTEQSIQSH